MPVACFPSLCTLAFFLSAHFLSFHTNARAVIRLHGFVCVKFLSILFILYIYPFFIGKKSINSNPSVLFYGYCSHSRGSGLLINLSLLNIFFCEIALIPTSDWWSHINRASQSQVCICTQIINTQISTDRFL